MCEGRLDGQLEGSVPKGYKQTEVGVIPRDWEVLPLGEILESTQLGGNYQNIELPSNYPLIKMGNLNRGNIDLDKLEYISPSQNALERDRLIRGDVLFNTRNTLELVGKVAIWNDELPRAYFNSNIMRLKFKKEWISSNRFMNYALNTSASLTSLRGLAIGTTSVAAIYNRDLVKLSLAVPSNKLEQQAIAEALSDADAMIEGLEALIFKKQQLKQGVIFQLFLETKDWEFKPFREVFDFYSTATNPRGDLSENGNAFYVHYGDIHTKIHNHLNFSKKKIPRISSKLYKNATQLQNGDWIIADVSEDYDGVGKSVEVLGLEPGVKAISGLHTFLLREKIPSFVLGFKGHLGNMKWLHEQYLKVATGMKVYGISKSALKNLLVPIPPNSEQEHITDVLCTIDKEIETLKEKLAKAKQIKEGMMQDLLTGKVRLL